MKGLELGTEAPFLVCHSGQNRYRQGREIRSAVPYAEDQLALEDVLYKLVIASIPASGMDHHAKDLTLACFPWYNVSAGK